MSHRAPFRGAVKARAFLHPHHITRRLTLGLPLLLAQRSALPNAEVGGSSPPRPTTVLILGEPHNPDFTTSKSSGTQPLTRLPSRLVGHAQSSPIAHAKEPCSKATHLHMAEGRATLLPHDGELLSRESGGDRNGRAKSSMSISTEPPQRKRPSKESSPSAWAKVSLTARQKRLV